MKRRIGKIILTVVSTPFHWVERARGRWRLALLMVYALIAATIGLFVYRASNLWGIPDIGDPFETALLTTEDVPDDQNAFTLYRLASARGQRSSTIEKRLFNTPYAWPKPSDTQGLAFLASNGEALRLWRKGCERPDALDIRASELKIDTPLPLLMDHRHFVRMALVVASKARDDGDMAGAWGWYRATLRGSRLIGRRGVPIAQLVGAAEYAAAQNLIRSWATDSRVDARLLCTALNDTKAINSMTAPPSEALKREYLAEMKSLEDPWHTLDVFIEDRWQTRKLDATVWLNHLNALWKARWFIEQEPIRSRRLIRLSFANWLSQCDKPFNKRPPMIGTKEHAAILFDVSLPGVQSVSALELAGKTKESMLTDWTLIDTAAFMKGADRDRAQRKSLIDFLTEQFHLRLLSAF